MLNPVVSAAQQQRENVCPTRGIYLELMGCSVLKSGCLGPEVIWVSGEAGKQLGPELILCFREAKSVMEVIK